MLHSRLIENLPVRKIFFVGSSELGEMVKSENEGDKIGFVNEDSIIPFNDVHSIISDILKEVLAGRELPRGITGWYYQQFLKMQYARICDDEYYLVWDGDTVPCQPFSMFSEDGKPYLDLKEEYHEEYFNTISKILPGYSKMIQMSFISEHMLMNSEIMSKLIADIENNDDLKGFTFYEKILRSIPIDKIQSNSFSEFETYGTFVVKNYMYEYKLRRWYSFRLGANYFDPNTICDRDFVWLAKDFDAISFEKNQSVREDHKNIFDNPYYQEMLSARKILELAQVDFKEGYKEVW